MMKGFWVFPNIFLLVVVIGVNNSVLSSSEVSIPYSPEYDPNEPSIWSSELGQNQRSARAMYLAQGVEFVFPIGVQYTLANVNEQLWPIGTNGFDSVLEFPKNKIAVMFSSMINTLKIANFSISSSVYTNEKVHASTALRILGTELKDADFKNNYKETWSNINKDIGLNTGGAINEFIPRGGLYGRSIYPFTKATFINSVHYENQWAFPWKQGVLDKFTDSPLVPYLEVEGLMPYYENDAFVAVAALFKSGTGSVVFLKPKGNITILQLMLNPTALTQIFDESFPGWGVKQMKVRIPEASFTTNSQHYDMLVKRGVTDAFCINDLPKGEGSTADTADRYSLNPIVQTNHIRVNKDVFTIASVTGVTVNSEKDLNEWNARQRDDVAPETLLEEYTTPKIEEDEETATSLSAADDSGVIIEDEVVATTISPTAEGQSTDDDTKGRKDLPSLAFNSTAPLTPEQPGKVNENVTKGEKKEAFSSSVDFYEFNEPFLWFLHAINEEPMFMGVIESFKRYHEETGNKENNLKAGSNSAAPNSGNKVIEKNGWIYEAAKGVLWHCPSMINKQTE